ncbi:MAG: YceI family protein [Gammaproteobacteria bacterium]|nr:YceI family protein [Gammaproteobacteria bacterium]NVK87929.1 YceI family protein [Gammaproteobacteria bacterium]
MRTIIYCCGLLLCSVSALAENWQLRAEDSHLTFTSVKNATIAENHHFNVITGKVTNNQDVAISIDLSSVDSGIEIRDQRMKEHLFDVAQFRYATISSQLNSQLLNDLKVGEMKDFESKATVALKGVEKSLSIKVRVHKLAANMLTVSTLEPVLVQANDFNLIAGILKLQQLAKLGSIDAVVPVTFNLVFDKQ